ncbi:transmembrane protein 132D [Acanthochromis polyacanthus]|uniref:transmembrane protein 132D n=1 Tax=Acanthochromis polyacanthus TaxID=80966 RepID=UPI0022343FA0|nr:transmembrane protein 132D [Acanthochromis polyacanthus]
MAGISRFHVLWRRTVELLIFWMSILVSPSLLQPTPPLSLPVHISVIPPLWQVFPLSQVELGPLFSNSSPFSFSQSIFMLPPPSLAPTPDLQASFGPYSVSELISAPVLPPSLLVSASLLSENVERGWDEEGQERFRVRALFHKRGNVSTQRSCITLHAFKDTEEHRASCISQPPLGLCVVTLTLPNGWFEDHHTQQPVQGPDQRYSSLHRRVQKRHQNQHHRANFNRQRPASSAQSSAAALWALRHQQNQIQLYYSSSGTVDGLQRTSAGCLEDRAAQSQGQLFFMRTLSLSDQEDKGRKPSRSRKEEVCQNRQEEEELKVDSHVVIRYHRGPVLVGQPIRVSVNLRANFTAQFAVISLKVKRGLVSIVARRTLTSDLWAVTLERSQSSEHDVVSIVCHKHSILKQPADPTVLQQVVCLSVDGLRQSFGVAMTVSANWWVEYSGRSNPPSSHRTAASVFSFTDRHIYGIAAVTESNTVINTAILTNRPVSLPVMVLAVGDHEKVSDVTSAVTCRSTNENTIKVSSDCSTLFVDGSESGLGNTCAEVDFVLGMLRGSVCVEVWAPSVPLQVSLADPVLNAIDGWNVLTENGCDPVYQRSSIQVLTQFTALDSSSKSVQLLGSSDWFVDVTELVRDWLRVEDSRVAALGPHNTVIGLRPGKTSLHIISEQWDGVLGRCDITVTPDAVAPGDLYVQVVSGLGMSVTAGSAHPSIVTATVTAFNILYHHQQEASISVWLQFSDDTASLLSTFSDMPFVLHLSSLAETVVVVASSPIPRVFAQGDGGGPLLRAELLVPACADEMITSNSIHEANREWANVKGNGGTWRLASGSGWIRVNLDLGFKQPGGKKDEEEFEMNISDKLVEAYSNIYTSGENEIGNVSAGYDYYDKISQRMTRRKWNEAGNREMVRQTTLERAVLMPKLEEDTMYSSPSQEKDEDSGTEEDGDGAEDLEVGLGAVLSLLCLSAVLFLANCLPCILRDRRRRTRTEEDREGQLGRCTAEDKGDGKKREGDDWEEVEMKNREDKEELNKKQEGINKEDVKAAEIICC